MDKPTTTRSNALGEQLLKNKLRHGIVNLNDTRSPQRKMMDEVFGAIGKYKLGRNVLSFAEKIGDGISERFSKKFQPYLTKIIDFVKPRDLEEEFKNKTDLLKTQYLEEPDARADLRALVSTSAVRKITKSLSTPETQPSGLIGRSQISTTSNQSKDKSRSH